MDAETQEICCGCLSSGRKMIPIEHYWSDRSFFHILADIPMLSYKECLLMLCWECRMHITNFIKFREQIKHSCNVLQEYLEQKNQTKPFPSSKLMSYIQKGIDIYPSDADVWGNDFSTMQEVCEEIKKEEAIIQHIKADDLLVKDEEVYSEDDRSLIDIRNEKIKDLRTGNKNLDRKQSKIKKKKKQDYVKIILTPEEVLKERHLLALREEYVNAMFKCEKCLITFPNEDDMSEHTVTKHALHSKHICSICERSFPSQNSLTVHGHRHRHRWRCVSCGHHGATERAATKHTHKHANSENYDIAEKAYQLYEENKSLEGVEMNGTKSEDQIPCEYCEKTFRWKTSLRKHMETHRIESGHKRRPFCEPCKLSFTTTANLRKHVSTSSKHQIQLKLRKLKEDLPQAPDLVQQAKDIESIKSKINSQREQYPCPQCDKKFQWKGNLLRHLKSHAARANGDLVCVPCNRTFSSIATYKQHMKISRKHVTENEFKYMCSDCGKRFSNKIKLRDHIDWDHLKNYTHTCGDCQKVFKSHTSLYLHKQVVHKQYNAEHLCDHCGKPFPNKTKLRSHIIAIHSRESPYKCSACSARFSWHSCLSRHVRRVHGNGPRER